jgi:hypothetical protein
MSIDKKYLENIIAITQRLLTAEKSIKEITPGIIFDKVRQVSKLFPNELTEESAKKITTELIQRFSHRIGKSTVLKDAVGHRDWLNFERKKNWQYWSRYQEYLEAKLSEVVVSELDRTTDEVLALLEDPHREDSWDRRGLVVGHVQSGKTSNYSGLICKAADAGYKIIIVLAGAHNNLRSQTQIRLEESFVGFETKSDRTYGGPVGVGNFGARLITNTATTRSENGDFSRVVADHFGGISPEERPWLFVVKKQKTVLTSLLNWIKNRVAESEEASTGRKLVTKLPLLMIDDEADYASVDTGELKFNDKGEPDIEYEPKTINKLIRQILHTFTRKAYVGYTATPFANIFIHHKASTRSEGPDLFPRSFIINLAAPSNYIGPRKIFGIKSADGQEGELPLIRYITDHLEGGNQDGWMPPKHKTNHIPIFEGQEKIPHSLDEAICSFILSCAVRELRGQTNQHSSMLIHVTRYMAVQKQVYDQVSTALENMRRRIVRQIDSETLIEKLRKIWATDFIISSQRIKQLVSINEVSDDLPRWEEILELLPNIVSDIQVQIVNGTARDALYFSDTSTFRKVIAIGGDKLSRGLTLEGLCVSYFVRTTMLYDTLMQMGRWFGYRHGYLDLCRLYTTQEMILWFRHIANASEELREELDFMAAARLTPEEYGLKVISHEALAVTSPLKMRNSKPLSLSYAGTRPQTILFHRDEMIQQQNLSASDEIIRKLGSNFISDITYKREDTTETWPNARLWRNVSHEIILDFLRSYVTHPNATSANAALLSDYISKMVNIGELNNWSVGLICGGNGEGKPHTFPGGQTTTSFAIRKTEDHPDIRMCDPKSFAIGVLTDPKDEGIDIKTSDWLEALERTRSVSQREELPKIPSGKSLRELRRVKGGDLNCGLLLLYPLSPYIYDDKNKVREIVANWQKPIMAFSIAFPECSNAIKVEYKVNLTYWSQEYGPSE